MINVVVEDELTNRPDIRYRVKRISDAHSNAQFSESSLRELTDKAIKYGYSIYSQDDYELVIRRKA